MPLLPGDRITLCAMQFFPIHPVVSFSNLSPRSDRAIFFSLSGSFVHALLPSPLFPWLPPPRTHVSTWWKERGENVMQGEEKEGKRVVEEEEEVRV